MKQFILFVFITTLLFNLSNCKVTTFNTTSNRDYKETLDSVNLNNKIFKVGTTFLYDYVFIHDGDSLKCNVLADEPRYGSNWELVNLKDATGKQNLIDKIQFKVEKEVFIGTQTGIEYNLLYQNSEPMKEATTWSGVIENHTRVWLHPVRVYEFNILNFSPYPYIHFPLKVGNSWQESLTGGCEKWLDCKVITVRKTYKIVRKEKLKTALGNLDCYVVQGEATSDLSKASLTAYFNEKYGFVKLDYINIDGNRLVMDMVDFKAVN